MKYSNRISQKEVAKKLPLLKVILKIKNLKNRRALLLAVGPEFINVASSIANDVLNGTIKIKNSRLNKLIFGKRNKDMKKLASPKSSQSTKLSLLLKGSQKGGGIFDFLEKAVNYLEGAGKYIKDNKLV